MFRAGARLSVSGHCLAEGRCDNFGRKPRHLVRAVTSVMMASKTTNSKRFPPPSVCALVVAGRYHVNFAAVLFCVDVLHHHRD